jgi:hypothetical protein
MAISYTAEEDLREFWKDMLGTFGEVLREALENNDTNLLTNLEAFATSVAAKPIIGRTIVRGLVERTLNERARRRTLYQDVHKDSARMQKFREQCRDNEEVKAELRKLTSQVVEISLAELIETELVDLNHGRVVTFLNGMAEMGFLDLHPPDGPPEAVSLTGAVWNACLSRVERRGTEVEMFSDCVGKILDMAIFRERVRSLKPLVLMTRRAKEGSSGYLELPETERIKCYADCGLAANKARTMAAGDNTKVEQIRFFKGKNGTSWLIPIERKETIERIIGRTQRRFRERHD